MRRPLLATLAAAALAALGVAAAAALAEEPSKGIPFRVASLEVRVDEQGRALTIHGENFGAVSRQVNELGAAAAMRILATAQRLYAEQRSGFARDLAELRAAGLIDEVLGKGETAGYTLTLIGDSFGWSATARPVQSGKSGDRSFFIDETGVIRATTGSTPPSTSSPIGG